MNWVGAQVLEPCLREESGEDILRFVSSLSHHLGAVEAKTRSSAFTVAGKGDEALLVFDGEVVALHLASDRFLEIKEGEVGVVYSIGEADGVDFA